MPPAAPFLPTAEEMGERTPPKTNGFWISFVSISMRRAKVPQGIGHGSTLAAADKVDRGHWRFYRFGRLSNRALASGGKRRCGPLGRHFKFYIGRAWHYHAERGSGSDKRTARDSLYDDQHYLGFRGGTRRRVAARSGAQEVLKPAVSSRPFGHFWGCGQK